MKHVKDVSFIGQHLFVPTATNILSAVTNPVGQDIVADLHFPVFEPEGGCSFKGELYHAICVT